MLWEIIWTAVGNADPARVKAIQLRIGKVSQPPYRTRRYGQEKQVIVRHDSRKSSGLSTASGLAGWGVRSRWRGWSSSPVDVSTTAALIPVPPTSIPSTFTSSPSARRR